MEVVNASHQIAKKQMEAGYNITVHTTDSCNERLEYKIETPVDCDIFIMPSRYESFKASGLEVMACFKPLILTENNHIQT